MESINWVVNGSVVQIGGNSYTVTNFTANTTVQVTFVAQTTAAVLYVSSYGSDIVEQYDATTGAPIPAFTAPNGRSGVALSGNILYVSDQTNYTVLAYNATTGAAIAGFTSPSGLDFPQGLAVSGSDLYVRGASNSTVGEYNATTGATINASLISGLDVPSGMAVSGNILYVANGVGNGTVGAYNATTGLAIPGFIPPSGLDVPIGLVVSGSDLYIANYNGGTIGEYNATTGATINASLITGLSAPEGMAISGNNLFVVNNGNGTVGEYDATTGAVIIAPLISGLSQPQFIALSPVPEISVQGPDSSELESGGSTWDFGQVLLGASTSGTFTITNSGAGDLTLGMITIDGTDSGDFAVTANPASPVMPSGGSTTFAISFAPGGLGSRAATLQISSNDPLTPSFDIGLAGAGTTNQITYTVTPSAGAGGSISPNIAQIVGSGTNVAFTATPASGYVVNQWLLNGSPAQTGGATYTLASVTANDTVQVTFSQNTTGEFYFPVSNPVVQNTAGQVTVMVSRNFTSAASVAYGTVDSTASNGIEYTGTAGTLYFAEGQTQATITVPIIEDDTAPGSTYFLILLSNPTPGDTIASSASSAGVFLLNEQVTDLSLSEPAFNLPQTAPPATGSITVTLSPAAADGQWKLFGELTWRDTGTTAAGLTSGNYEVEFKPVNNYQSPDLQVVPLFEGQQANMSGSYTASGSPATGSLQVTLAPAGIGGWRIQGQTAWQSSGATLANLNTGDYILEFEPVNGLVTPSDAEAVVQANALTQLTDTYLIGDSTIGLTPVLVSDTVAQTQPPYAFTGQVQTDEGFGTGFVPLDRVVVTAAHVLFDDITLSYVQGVRWFFQYESGTFETPPQIPAGSYVLDGYAAQRAADNTPGVASAASRQLDAAALYFLEPAARGGQSGYLASNSPSNSWLTGTAEKFIAGYPIVNGTTGYLYATPMVQDAFDSVAGSVFSTTAITSYPGNSGGPLFVQYSDGNFYPAAIYLGGSDETVVHAIDSDVIALMNDAEVSGNGGANNNSGGSVDNPQLAGPTLQLGSITVTLEPAGAVSDGAYWEIGDGVRHSSGESLSVVAPGSYTVQFFTDGQGYSAPENMLFNVAAATQTPVTGTYIQNLPGHPAGTYLALLQGGTYGDSGFAQLTIEPSGRFTATFNLGGSSVKVRNTFTIQSKFLSGYQGTFKIPGGRSLSANLSLTSGAVLSGTLIDQSDSSQIAINAERTASHADQALAGTYTVLLPAVSGTSLPGGNGFGALTVSKTGAVKFDGQLGDGVPVRLSGSLDSSGVWSFFFNKPGSKSAGAELVLGSVAFPLAANGPAGTLSWYRRLDSLYPGGFSTSIPFVAGPYIPPAVKYTSATVTFTGGNLGGPMVVPVSIGAKDKVTVTGKSPFTLKFTPKTGLFAGAFSDGGKVRTFFGAVFQGEGSGLGLFQDASGQTGSVLLQETP